MRTYVRFTPVPCPCLTKDTKFKNQTQREKKKKKKKKNFKPSRTEQNRERVSVGSKSMDANDPSPSLLHKQISNISLCTDDSDEEADFQSAVDAPEDFVPSPLIPLKKQLELDKVL